MNYSIERISVDNLKHVHTLYKVVFRKQVSYDFLLRKYDTSFTGIQYVGYLAFTPDGRPAAFYGVLPCRFTINKKTVLAAQSADTMTHPDHRKAGLFLMLAERTYALAREHGIEFIFGFPNQNSLPGFKKLNWNFLPSHLKLFVFPASPVPFFTLIARIPILRKGYNNVLKSLYRPRNDPADFMQKVADGLIRDEQFLLYKRYSETFFINIGSALVWIKPETIFKVGYVDVENQESIALILKKVRRIAVASGCREVVFMTSVNTALYKALLPHTTPKDSFPIGIFHLTNEEYDLRNTEFHYCDIDIF